MTIKAKELEPLLRDHFSTIVKGRLQLNFGGIGVELRMKERKVKEGIQVNQLVRLQNSPYFCVFKYARAVKQKVCNEAENREQDWGETLKIRFFFSRLTRP